MSTFMAKANEIDRKWYILDAEGKSLGRVAAVAADLLRGKNEPIFTPHVDCGNHVIVINADKAVLTGKKLEQKYYRRHTGYIGGLKEVQYKTLMATRPELAMELAIKGMVVKHLQDLEFIRVPTINMRLKSQLFTNFNRRETELLCMKLNHISTEQVEERVL